LLFPPQHRHFALEEEPMMRFALTSLALSLATAPPAAAAELNESFPVGPGGTLRMNLDRGRISVQRHDAHEVRIEAHARGLTAFLGGFTAHRTGNDVTLEGVFSWSFLLVPWGPRVRVDAWVPADYSVALDTRGGAITIEGVTGRVVAHTSGGRVEVHDVDGPVSVQTSGGAIEVANVEGSVVAHTSGGRIAGEQIIGNVEVKTSGGAIALTNIDGRIEATTSGGAITATFIGEPEGILQTSGGRIDVGFPAAASVDLDAETSGGSISVDHEIATTERGGRRVVGEINGGGPQLRLRTSGGAIHVQAT
jgi:hypothetical protein